MVDSVEHLDTIEKAGAGNPVAVTVNAAADPTVKVAAVPLVTAGAWVTVRVKNWVASDPAPLPAVIVNV